MIQENPITYPAIPEQFLEWWRRNQFFKTAIVSGRCIPDLISNLNRIVFLLSKADLDAIATHLNNKGTMNAVVDFHFQDKLSFLKIELDSQNFTCDLYSLDDVNLKLNCPEFSYDSFIYSLECSYWHDELKNKMDFPEKVFFQNHQSDKNLDSLQKVLNTIITSAKVDLGLDLEIVKEIKVALEKNPQKSLPQNELGSFLMEIIQSKHPGLAFFSMHDLGILGWFLPELESGFGLSQNKYHKYDIADHCIYTCNAVKTPDPGLRFSALLHDIGKVVTRKLKSNGEASFHNHEVMSTRLTRKIFNRTGLNEDRELLKRVIFLVRNHMFHYTNDWTDKAVRRFINKVDTDQLDDLITLRIADRKGSGKRSSLPQAIKELIRHISDVRKEESELKIRNLKITGHDLMGMGLQAGPLMGDLLKLLLEEVKNDDLQNEPENLRCRVEYLIHNEKKFLDLKTTKSKIKSGTTT